MVIKKQGEKLQYLVKGNISRTDRIAFDFPSEIEFDGLISSFNLPLQWLPGCFLTPFPGLVRWRHTVTGCMSPPRPRFQASLIGPLGAAPEKKIRHVYWESRFFIWEEVKTRGDVVQVCVVRGHSSWYANVLVHRTLQQRISNFNVLNKVSNFCVEKKGFCQVNKAFRVSWVHEEEIALNSCQRYILFVYWFR